MFPSISLNNYEKQLVSSVLPSTSQVHHGAICRLYKTHDNVWEKRLFGAVLILTDSDSGSHFIELVDMNKRQISFSQQLYNNFVYNKSTNYFHTFETEDGIIGLSFANEPEADRFYHRVQQCAHPRRIPARPPRPYPPPNVVPTTISPTIPETLPPQLPIQPAGVRPTVKAPESLAPRAASPIMRTIPESQSRVPQARASMPVISYTKSDLNAMQDKTKEEKPKLTQRRSFFRETFSKLVSPSKSNKEIVISAPTDFRHVSRIGYNPQQGTFEISNIPPEWKQFFADVGIKKSDLKNKETATMVMNIIENHNASAPPPIPPRRATVTEKPSNSPPPIPPRRSTISEATPPSIPTTSNTPPPIPPRPRMAPPPVPNTDGAPPPPPLPPAVSQLETAKSPAESPSARSRPSRGAEFERQLSSAKLKHVETNTSFKSAGGDLASTLMRAMEERRTAIREDAQDYGSDDEDWDL